MGRNFVAQKLDHLMFIQLKHGVDWTHDSIVQHEVSHNFDADEGGWFTYEHPAECIMNYQWAYDSVMKRRFSSNDGIHGDSTHNNIQHVTSTKSTVAGFQ